jgi:hypothetical protein
MDGNEGPPLPDPRVFEAALAIASALIWLYLYLTGR